MPAIEENTSELLQDGYHRVRHPEEYSTPFSATAFEARLRAIRERKNPAIPSWHEIWHSLKESWAQAGKTWDAEKGRRTNQQEQQAAETRQP
jgi:hypothetical protein